MESRGFCDRQERLDQVMEVSSLLTELAATHANVL
jgi:hypothetical protein